jgi:elongation factor G
MQNLETKNIRTIGIFGHSNCGKTILADSMLYNAKATTRIGSIVSGSTISDYTEEEKKRQISISTGCMHYDWKGKHVFMLDTPGYMDFIGEVISAMRVVDGTIIVVDGISGVEVGTSKVMRMVDSRKMPTMMFVNKLDKEHSDFYKIVDSLVEAFGKKCVPVQFPIGKEKDFKGVVNIITGQGLDSAPQDVKDQVAKHKEKMAESVAETDDALLEKYLEAGALTDEQLSKGLLKGVLSGALIPILCGSAEKNLGIAELMDTIISVFPSPEDMGEIKTVQNGKTLKPDKNGALAALVFKNIADPYVGQLTVFRIYSGTIKGDTDWFNSTKGAKERFGKISILQGKDHEDVPELIPGCFGAVTKLKDTGVGDTISSVADKIIMDGIVFPRPVMSLAVHPKSRNDESKVMDSLHKLGAEDPTFRFTRNAETKQTIIEGMGDIHLEVMTERLKSKFDVNVDLSTPKVAYKETITAKAEADYKHKKQSGGSGQFAHVFLRVAPKPRGEGYEFVNEVKGGVIPTNFIPAVDKGIQSALDRGILAGCPVVDIQAIVYYGKDHPVDSNDIAFRLAASKAFQLCIEKARPVLLEPIMNVSITIPSEYMGDINGDMSSRRGRIIGMEPDGNLQVIKATVPAAEMFKYASELRSITGGRGTFSMEFSHYEEVPANEAQKIIDAYRKEKENQ